MIINPKEEKNEPKLSPMEAFLWHYSTVEKCYYSVFYARAIKETQGCHRCGENILENYKKTNDKRNRKCYQCGKCSFQIYVTAGTVLHGTRVKLPILFYVAVNKLCHNTGFSANSIKKDFNLSAETAWSLNHKIRKWMKSADKTGVFKGEVYIDETAVLTGAKGLKRRGKRGFSSDRITPYLTIMERGGNVKSFQIADREANSLLPIIVDNVAPGSIIHTDGWKGYSNLSELGYKHITVNHNAKQYKDPNTGACTNAAEGYFGHIKPNLISTYRNISEAYSNLYLGEHDFRYNFRNEPMHARFQALLDSLPPLFEHVRNKGKK